MRAVAIAVCRLAVCAIALSACVGAKPARPHTFVTTASPAATIDHAVRVLAQHGMSVDRVDERAGVVQTRWQATQFRYGQTPDRVTRFITRRFTVTVSPQARGAQVFVRVKDMACGNPDAFIAGDATVADCQVVDGVVPPDQALLDRVGQDLSRALGVTPHNTVAGRKEGAK